MKKDKALEAVIKRFGDAMRTASVPFVANNPEAMTARMRGIWVDYVMLMQSRSKKETYFQRFEVYK